MTPIQELWAFLLVNIMNPGQNKQATILIYVTVFLLVALFIVMGALFALGGEDEDEEYEDEEAGAAASSTKTGGSARRPAPATARERLLAIGGSVLLFFAVWVAAGYSTSNSELCKACHNPQAVHARANVADPHKGTDCVSCHEPGGAFGRYFADVPVRAAHVLLGQMESPDATQYGQVTSVACASCHRKSLKAPTMSVTRALRMSHAEPMAASAACLDCHQLKNGVVGAYNAGMKQCLRCHDGEVASTECDSCHTEKASASARARSTAFRGAQIKDINCGGCHDEKKECDSCHGLRMPHTDEFMSGAHARAAAVNFWYQDGKVCVKCHTATRRPCSCHTSVMGKAHGVAGASMPAGHKKSNSQACNACHGQWATTSTRDFCKDVCHSEAAIKYSPR